MSGLYQRGVVLITTLVMLVLLTLLAISTLKTSVIELKIGGAHHVSVRNLSNAESALQQFINVNRNNYGGVFVGTGAGALVTDVTVTPTQVYCVDNFREGSGNSGGNETLALTYDLASEAEDPIFSARSVVHQGVTATVAGGDC